MKRKQKFRQNIKINKRKILASLKEINKIVYIYLLMGRISFDVSFTAQLFINKILSSEYTLKKEFKV